jgi:EmrB/QacA subfamily drug resistance transporter
MLGAIDAEFGITEALGQWLTTAYMLAVGITVPVVTVLTAKMSVRKVTLLALVIFAAGAVCDLCAPNFALLLFGRVLQAVSTGITMTLLQTIAMTRFPPGQNGTAMGVAGMAMGFAPNIGPLIGGAFVGVGWRAFFALVLGLACVFALVLIVFLRSEVDPRRPAKLDLPSLLLSTCGFTGLLMAFTNAAQMALVSTGVLLPLLAGVCLSAVFVWCQGRISNPLINMKIFASGKYRVGFAFTACLTACFMGITLVLPLFVINVGGHSTVDGGLVFLPATVAAVAINPLSGFMADKFGARPVCVGFGAVLVVGSVLMIFMSAQTPLWLVSVLQLVRGIGVSGLMGPITSHALSQLKGPLVVHGSAFLIMGRQASASFGTACMMIAVSALGQTEWAFACAFALSAAFAIIALILAIWKLR